MAIHHAVRDIVDQVGTGVLADPESFRGVLDDVLDEDAADVGDVNLLVDAVRFGAVDQLVRLLDTDAEVRRAVETVGAGFARLRGGADLRASSWACAVLGFAIRRVPEQVVLDLATGQASAAPPPSAPPPPPPQIPSPVPPPGPSPTPTRVITAPAAPPPSYLADDSRKGSTGKIIAIVGLVVAIIAAGYVGWRFFWPRGGADSPEEAVEQLMLAAAEQDAVGVLDMLSPAEVDGLDDVYDALRERAEEEDLVDEGDGITDAVDLEFSGLEFEVDELGDDLAGVTLTGGEYDAGWDPSELPDRLDFVAAEAPANSESGNLDDLFDGEEPTVTTVEIDGRWYVTLVGTAAFYAYEEAEDEAESRGTDLDSPDYDLAGEEADAVTGDEPEEVIANLADAINDEDVGRFLANLPEDLVKPLRPYIPVVEGALADDAWSDGEPGLDVGAQDLDLDTEDLDDGKVKVVINQGSFSGTVLDDGVVVDGGSAEVRGDCIGYYPGFDESEGDCLSDSETAADLGLDEIFFVLREVDGGYQLDPAATLQQYADAVVDGLSTEVVEKILADLENEF